MRVRVLGDRLRDSGYDLSKDDTITVPDEIGAVWCSHGWAEDAEGAVATGERLIRGVAVQPQNAVLGVTSETAGS